MNFQSERLIFRRLLEVDREGYFDMMSNPNVMNPVPRPVMSKEESDENFNKHSTSDFSKTDVKPLAVLRKDTSEFIGLVAYLKNDEGDDEIGYRLREKHWGIGFGTEICKELIDYGFSDLGFEKITADVNMGNIRSVKILDKFFTPVREFMNVEDNCMDRRYEVFKKD